MESDHVAVELDERALNRHLESAQRELDALSELVAEVPVLMEARFKRELVHQLALNQSLVQERYQLTELIGSLNTSSEHMLTGPRLPKVSLSSRAFMDEQGQGCLSFLQRFLASFAQLKWRQLLVVIGGGSAALGLLLVVLRADFSSDQPSRLAQQPISKHVAVRETAPKASVLTYPVTGSPESLIELSATDATWLEVSDRQGQPLLQDTLTAGDQRRVRLRDGLELYAARPELLRFRVDDGPWQPVPDAFLTSGLILLTPESR